MASDSQPHQEQRRAERVFSDPPTLELKYSGIPERLLEKARKTKQLVFQNQTKESHTKRERDLAIPKGVSKRAFSDAISELQGILGAQYVVLNDKALEDGWLVSH
jgi:hypothetical protein